MNILAQYSGPSFFHDTLELLRSFAALTLSSIKIDRDCTRIISADRTFSSWTGASTAESQLNDYFNNKFLELLKAQTANLHNYVTYLYDRNREEEPIIVIAKISTKDEKLPIELFLLKLKSVIEKQSHILDNQLITLSSMISDGFIVVDQNWSIYYCNEQAKKIFSLEPSACENINLWDCLPELASFAFKSLQRAQRAHENVTVVGSYPPTGVTVEINGFPTEMGMTIVVRDVSKETSALKAASQQQAFLHSTLENIFDGIVVINSGGAIVNVNSSICRITGYTKDELLNNNITILMGDEFALHHNNYIKQYLMARRSGVVDMRREIRIKRKDGEYFPAEISVTKMESNGETVFIGSIHDITSRKIKEKEIAELARFPAENWNPVMKISFDGMVLYANAKSNVVLHTWRASVGGQVPDEIVSVVKEAIISNVSKEFVQTCSSQIFSFLFAPVPEANAVYAYGRDITQQKKDEAEILSHRNHLEELVEERTRELAIAIARAEDASRAKSIFLANMSHEIRTPLTAIIGFAETLSEPDLTDIEREKAITTVLRSGRHLQQVINDILDLSKIEARKLDIERIRFNVFSVIGDVNSMFAVQAREKGVDFRIEYQYPLPRQIFSDPIRLKQILFNLCSNAIKFTEGGRIIVDISFDAMMHKLLVSVTDSGIGMSDDQIKKLFNAFAQADNSTTRKYGGTGLGLTISKQLAIMLGGDIVVESNLGMGSRFTFNIDTGEIDENDLTWEDTHVATDREINTPVSPPLQLSGSILLAEDTPALRDLVVRYLTKAGLTVKAVENGEDAVKEATTGDYSLVLMDIQMPVMDGLSAVKFLRKNNYTKPVIAMTANVSTEEKEKYLSGGFDDFVAKPIQRDVLFNSIIRFVSSQTETVSDTAEPIISSLIHDEPDMKDLVEKFVETLPTFISELKQAVAEENYETALSVAHKLKGLGGGYGYAMITELAAALHAQLEKREGSEISRLVTEMENLSSRIVAGVKL